MSSRTIDDYIATARARSGHDSDNQLAKQGLGITSAAISAWRQGKTFPKDGIMIHLAALAEIDTHEALLDLNRWRAKDPAAQKEYAALLRRLQRAAAAILVAVLVPLGFGSQSADAALEQSGNIGRVDAQYYTLSAFVRSFVAALRRLLRRCCAALTAAFKRLLLQPLTRSYQLHSA